MTIQSELQPASFKNVPFLVTGTSTSGGRKTITHEFVNSNKRNVEDLGLLQKTFTLTAVITGPNYTSKRNALVRVLEEGGRGELIHPFFGKVNVVAKPYTVTENLDALGEAVFNLTFERSELNANPQASGSSIATISKLNDNAQASVSQDIVNNFKVSSQFIRNFVASETLLGDVSDHILSASKFVTQSSQQINTFSDANTSFVNDIRSLINSPTELGGSLVNLFNSLTNLGTNPIDINKSLNTLFTFGDDYPAILPINAERIERLNNFNTIVLAIKTLALCGSYSQVVQIQFTTVNNIDLEQERLDNIFNLIIDDLDIATRKIVADLRNNTRDFLDRKRISAKRIITEETKSIPAQVLTFNLYGNLDFVQEIIDLNNIDDVSFIEGSVQVLS